jgi:hypothetical protein
MAVDNTKKPTGPDPMSSKAPNSNDMIGGLNEMNLCVRPSYNCTNESTLMWPGHPKANTSNACNATKPSGSNIGFALLFVVLFVLFGGISIRLFNSAHTRFFVQKKTGGCPPVFLDVNPLQGCQACPPNYLRLMPLLASWD